jgi:hypothetical protein
VGGVVVTKDELADFVFSRFREQWRQAVDELVDERLVATQAAALGVTVPPAALDAAVDAEARARAEQLRARFGDGADLARSVLEYYGLEVEAWKREILRPRLEVHLALQRVVRLSARTRDQVVARVIVVKDRAKAEAVRAKVAAGADFSLTALEASEDPSREQGGVVAPIGRGDLPLPAVEAALFGARPGALVGPLEVATAAGPEFHLYRVVEQVPAWPGPPEARRVRLEEDLRTNPVTRTEYERWAARSRRAQGVRVFGPDGSVLREVGPGR